MTLHLLDVASYQGSLATADVVRGGFGGVNLKVSHGLTRKSVHPDVAGWVDRAKSAGIGISTFHYMTPDASGESQAEYAYQQVSSLGLAYGTAHQLDVEAKGIAEGAVRAYLDRMTTLMGRPCALYTGDWYWPKSWNVADLTPYLWAAPNAGYGPSYPGDASPAWTAGYGGWPVLSVMQYAVSPLPLAGANINVSMSAIRDPEVWRSLTQGRTGMSFPPAQLMAARQFYIDTLKKAGFVIDPLAVGIKGDDSHANAGTSYHLGKDALRSDAYSVVESSRDRAGLTNAASALDLGAFSIVVKGRTHNLRTFSVWLVAQCRAGAADVADIREVIYSDDGVTVKRWDRLGKRTTGDSSHLLHTHESWFRDSENRDKTAHLRRYFTEIGILEDPDMPITSTDLTAIFKTDGYVGTPSNASDRATNQFRTLAESLTNIEYYVRDTRTALAASADALMHAISALASSDRVDEVALAAALAPGVADAIIAKLPAVDGVTAEELTAAVRAVAHEAFGGGA